MRRIYLTDDMFYEVYQNGSRTIYAPSKELKSQQRQILNFIKTKYKIKLNAKECAQVHCRQKWILKLDIRKFFESFTEKQIRDVVDEIFENVTFPEYYDKFVIYDLCTVENKLPTGAVTSSYFANIAFANTQIDDRLIEFCIQNKLNYSRYMDDMFFSGRNKSDLKRAEKLAIKLLKESGFNINHEKTQYISENKRQEILGLVVNNKENCVIPCDTKHAYRSMFFNYLKAVYLEERLGINSLFKKRVGFKEISGYLAYIKMSDPKFYGIMKNFITSKADKFGLSKNKEVKKLTKMLK